MINTKKLTISKEAIRRDCRKVYEYYKEIYNLFYRKYKINPFIFSFSNEMKETFLRKNNFFSFNYLIEIKKLKRDLEDSTLRANRELLETETLFFLKLLENKVNSSNNSLQNKINRNYLQEFTFFYNFLLTCLNTREDKWIYSETRKFIEDKVPNSKHHLYTTISEDV